MKKGCREKQSYRQSVYSFNTTIYRESHFISQKESVYILLARCYTVLVNINYKKEEEMLALIDLSVE